MKNIMAATVLGVGLSAKGRVNYRPNNVNNAIADIKNTLEIEGIISGSSALSPTLIVPDDIKAMTDENILLNNLKAEIYTVVPVMPERESWQGWVVENSNLQELIGITQNKVINSLKKGILPHGDNQFRYNYQVIAERNMKFNEIADALASIYNNGVFDTEEQARYKDRNEKDISRRNAHLISASGGTIMEKEFHYNSDRNQEKEMFDVLISLAQNMEIPNEVNEKIYQTLLSSYLGENSHPFDKISSIASQEELTNLVQDVAYSKFGSLKMFEKLVERVAEKVEDPQKYLDDLLKKFMTDKSDVIYFGEQKEEIIRKIMQQDRTKQRIQLDNNPANTLVDASSIYNNVPTSSVAKKANERSM